MSMCLTCWWRNGSSDKLIAALLSHRMIVEDGGVKSIIVSRACSQIASLEASNAAVYSALHKEVATVFCLRALHEINPDPRVKPYPPTLLLVSRQLVQSESVKPMSFTSPVPPKRSFKACVPLRSRTTQIAAFQCEYE